MRERCRGFCPAVTWARLGKPSSRGPRAEDPGRVSCRGRRSRGARGTHFERARLLQRRVADQGVPQGGPSCTAGPGAASALTSTLRNSSWGHPFETHRARAPDGWQAVLRVVPGSPATGGAWRTQMDPPSGLPGTHLPFFAGLSHSPDVPLHQEGDVRGSAPTGLGAAGGFPPPPTPLVEPFQGPKRPPRTPQDRIARSTTTPGSRGLLAPLNLRGRCGLNLTGPASRT
jgi:hypothetical protein